MSETVKMILGVFFTIVGGITVGLFLLGVNKFISVCNMMLTHDFKIKDLSDQVDNIDNKIDHMDDTIKKNIIPINKRVEAVELDIKKIKVHTKYKD